MTHARDGLGRSDAALARVVERGYWREADARIVIEALERSGLSLEAFARQHRIEAKRLGRWKRRLDGRGGEARGSEPLTFFPIRVREEERAAGAASVGVAVELVVGRYVVRLGAGFEPSVLARLIDVLEHRGG